jgi:formylglycine-generating enzyme required for sulfatase activity
LRRRRYLTILGNVWELCEDTFVDDAYSRHAVRNPLFEDSGPERVIRGGSRNLDAWSARCARRLGFAADFTGAGLGFRLVMRRNLSA